MGVMKIMAMVKIILNRFVAKMTGKLFVKWMRKMLFKLIGKKFVVCEVDEKDVV